jgi:membrane carboxypeptidase/penicillin-binding protein PbpC
MGEDTLPYSQSIATSSYSNTSAYPVKLEAQAEEMVPYQLANSDVYCSEQKVMETVGEKSYQEEMLDEYNERPHLHHMPSISTTCTSDSFSLTSADAEVSAFDLNASESQDFDWSINAASHFQWPPNRTFSSLCY